MTRTELLYQAESIVTGERQQAYGSVEDNFGRIAVRWSQIFGVTVTAYQVALAMIDLKMARAIFNPQHLDNLVDIAGYAACAVELPGEADVAKNCSKCRHLQYTGFTDHYFCGHYERYQDAAAQGCEHWDASEKPQGVRRGV